MILHIYETSRSGKGLAHRTMDVKETDKLFKAPDGYYFPDYCKTTPKDIVDKVHGHNMIWFALFVRDDKAAQKIAHDFYMDVANDHKTTMLQFEEKAEAMLQNEVSTL